MSDEPQFEIARNPLAGQPDQRKWLVRSIGTRDDHLGPFQYATKRGARHMGRFLLGEERRRRRWDQDMRARSAATKALDAAANAGMIVWKSR